MTIRGAELAVSKARLVLEENLEARILAINTDAADGLAVPMPRPGIWPDGDFFEWDAGSDLIERFPAITIHVDETRRAVGVDANVLAQDHQTMITVWDTAEDGDLAALVKRLQRYEAAVKDLFTYRKGRLETLLDTTGPASGCGWQSSAFVGEDNIRAVVLRFAIRIHETK